MEKINLTEILGIASSDKIRSIRGKNVLDAVKSSFDIKIENLKNQIKKLEFEKINSISNLLPKNSDDLTFNFNPDEFVEREVDYLIKKRNLEIELELLEKSYKEFFSE